MLIDQTLSKFNEYITSDNILFQYESIIAYSVSMQIAYFQKSGTEIKLEMLRYRIEKYVDEYAKIYGASTVDSQETTANKIQECNQRLVQDCNEVITLMKQSKETTIIKNLIAVLEV